MSRGLQELPSSRHQLNAGATCVDTVMQMGGAWIDSSKPPKPLASPTSDPGALADGGTTADLTDVINGTFSSNGTTFKYQPGSVHLFSNRPTRPNDPTGYQNAINKLNAKQPQGKGTFCTVVTAIKGKTTGPRELCVSVLGTEGQHQTADAVVSKAKPGATFLADNTAGPTPPHLGFALRVRKGRVQVFDTGGFGVDGRNNGVSVMTPTASFHGGNYDDPLTKTLSGGHPFRGTGIFPPVAEKDAEAMRTHVLEVLRKARPLGLAKLVLLKRGVALSNAAALAGALVYASPLLAMYSDVTPTSNYAVSRLLWSLRGLPGSDKLEAVWMVYAPLRSLAAALRDADRSKTAIQVASELSGLSPSKALHGFLLANLNPMADVVSRADGTVQLLGKAGKTSPHRLGLFVTRGDLRLDLAVSSETIDDKPPYFHDVP